jgi:DNA-directed RNA polymerase subunit RPC12/RpoP
MICAECGTVYEITGKKPGREVGDTSGATKCHNCGETFLHEFPASTDEEIIALGFTAAEYK